MEVTLPRYSVNEPVIHRLVDDILEYIFLFYATPPGPYSDPKVGHETTVASSQVCTRWRSIALNCHTIWGLIIDYPLHSPKWIEKLLDRSNPSSLDFGSRLNSVYLKSGGRGVLELVFNHIDRLRIFNLNVPVSTWELVRSRFLQLPAPNLEFVNVSFLDIAGHLKHPLFDNNAPKLQALGLLRCSVHFTSPVLTPLTELYVNTVGQENTVSVVDWLNILGGMPSLRWVTLIKAISIAPRPANETCPVIHLGALNMLSVDGPFHECVTVVKHLNMPPRCGLRLRCDDVQVGFDQRQLWAIIEKKIVSWEKNSNRYFLASIVYGSLIVKNVLHGSYNDTSEWGTEATEVHNQRYYHFLDPIMTIRLRLSNFQEAVPRALFLSLFALFERTFFDTTYLHLQIYNDDDDDLEDFLPLLDIFRGFLNLEKLYIIHDSLVKLLFSHLQQANSVLLPALKSLHFHDVTFGRRSNSILRVADFLQWRREQGFPVQKIAIEGCSVNRKYVLTHVQDTSVEMDGSNYWESDMEEDYPDSDAEEEDDI